MTWDTLCWVRGCARSVDNLRWDLRLGRMMMLMTQPSAGLCRITAALDAIPDSQFERLREGTL